MNIQSLSNIFERDTVAAFCQHAPVHIEASKAGLLNGLSYGLKDIYDIEGIPTGFGSPAWLNSHPIPTISAAFIQTLCNAGATLLGKTHTDELTYSILGINAHYGTPINSASPERVPGGSSSGSAAAVAAGLVDFAIGSDTGGSVRAPASFCGIYGIRTTHGRISLANARPLAKSFDALGWFAQSPKILRQVGEALLNKEVASIHKKTITKHFNFSLEEISITPEKLSDWAETFRIVQASEIWQEHGQWAQQHLHEFGPGIKERFEIAQSLDPIAVQSAIQNKNRITHYIRGLISALGDSQTEAILVLPSTGCIAPLLNSSASELEQVRKHLFQLLCIAGLGGLPQINLPLCKYEGAPLGLSLIGNANEDLLLLNIADEMG